MVYAFADAERLQPALIRGFGNADGRVEAGNTTMNEDDGYVAMSYEFTISVIHI
jgi:hypothetical protein